MSVRRAGSGRSPPPRHSAARLLATAIAALLLTTHGARTQETRKAAASHRAATIEVWVCSDHGATARDGRPPLEFEMKDGLLIERPLGMPRYHLLADNEHAIIGVDHFADFEPVLGMVNIFVSTVTIDRSTGNFTIATTVSDKVLEPRTGKCRRFEEQAASEKVLAQRK